MTLRNGSVPKRVCNTASSRSVTVPAAGCRSNQGWGAETFSCRRLHHGFACQAALSALRHQMLAFELQHAPAKHLTLACSRQPTCHCPRQCMPVHSCMHQHVSSVSMRPMQASEPPSQRTSAMRDTPAERSASAVLMTDASGRGANASEGVSVPEQPGAVQSLPQPGLSGTSSHAAAAAAKPSTSQVCRPEILAAVCKHAADLSCVSSACHCAQMHKLHAQPEPRPGP